MCPTEPHTPSMWVTEVTSLKWKEPEASVENIFPAIGYIKLGPWSGGRYGKAHRQITAQVFQSFSENARKSGAMWTY